MIESFDASQRTECVFDGHLTPQVGTIYGQVFEDRIIVNRQTNQETITKGDPIGYIVRLDNGQELIRQLEGLRTPKVSEINDIRERERLATEAIKTAREESWAGGGKAVYTH